MFGKIWRIRVISLNNTIYGYVQDRESFDLCVSKQFSVNELPKVILQKTILIKTKLRINNKIKIFGNKSKITNLVLALRLMRNRVMRK